jgi:hypothetical protein
VPKGFLRSFLLLVLAIPYAMTDTGDDALDVATLLDAIEASPFVAPLHLESQEGEQEVRGRVVAILEVPLPALRTALATPRAWCEILFLHYNIKSCLYRGQAEDAELSLSVGRKHYQDPEVARQVRLDFHVEEQHEGRLAIALRADRGPLGMRAFQFRLLAVPLDEQRSLVRLEYAVGYGRLARFAMRVYFATVGQDRVGFTVEGVDEDGTPILVRGQRGMIERNTLRFYYALSAYLRMPAAEQWTARHAHWFELTERHPRQLMEMDQDTYLAQKRRERRNQTALQAEFEAQ